MGLLLFVMVGGMGSAGFLGQVGWRERVASGENQNFLFLASAYAGKKNIDTTKRLMSSPKCRSVEVINNPARPGWNHREVNCINYK
jgi:hypothetical protein